MHFACSMKHGIFTTSMSLLSDLLCQINSYLISDANNLHTALFTGYNKLVLPDFPVRVQAEYTLLTINALVS